MTIKVHTLTSKIKNFMIIIEKFLGRFYHISDIKNTKKMVVNLFIYLYRYLQLRVESTQPILSRAFRANIPTTKSQTGNILGVTLSDTPRRLACMVYDSPLIVFGVNQLFHGGVHLIQ